VAWADAIGGVLQHLHKLGIATLGSKMQRRRMGSVLGIEVGAFLNQQAGDAGMAFPQS
jgi:hypothetical protein